jgi:RNA polymerase sigma-70 factor (ECF subfamily)
MRRSIAEAAKQPRPSEAPDRVFEAERTSLFAIAIRILRSDRDAEDVLQEAWHRFSQADHREIENISAWCTTVMTRLCLDVLRRRRNELPLHDDHDLVDPTQDPEAVTLLAGELTGAFELLVRRLSPTQRVAFILHDVFDRSFGEIADILEVTPDAARKLASRARHRVRGSTRREAPVSDDHWPIVEAFLRAAQSGDLDALVRLLHPDIVRVADPQILPSDLNPLLQSASAVVAEAPRFRAHARLGRVALIDGRPGIVLRTAGRLRAVIAFEIHAGRIERYDVIADPDRLAVIAVEEQQ